MPQLQLIDEDGAVCVSLPTWARAEWKLQKSLTLQSWTDLTLPADDGGTMKYLPPANEDRGYFRMTRK
jgi:hypothetical protein